MRLQIGILMLALVLLVAPLGYVWGHGTPDQSHPPDASGSLFSRNLDVGPNAQSFKPSISRLVAVNVYLIAVCDPTPCSETVSVKIQNSFPTGLILGGSTPQSVTIWNTACSLPQLIHFELSSPVNTPPATYYLEVVGDGSGRLSWCGDSLNHYSNGQAIEGGTPIAGDDYFFRTLAPDPDFSIRTDPSSITAEQGESRSSTITVTAVYGFSSPIDLTSTWIGTSPSGVSITLAGSLTPPRDGSSSTSLGLAFADSATTGTYVLRVTGRSGTINHEALVIVRINPSGRDIFDFSISALPGRQSVPGGGTTVFQITVNLVAGTPQLVSLRASGLPDGIQASFQPSSSSPPFTSSLTLTVNVGTSAGTRTITIIGQSGSITKSATVTMEVTGLISAAIPGFSYESIILGLALGSIVLLYARKRRLQPGA